MEEVWKDVSEYPYSQNYQVSNIGRVRSKDHLVKYNKSGSYTFLRGRILKQIISTHGYYHVVLSYKGKTKQFSVHRLVAGAFIENKNNYRFVNHKDENKKNNNVSNLEWCTPAYNIQYGTAPARISRTLRNNSPAAYKIRVTYKGKTSMCKSLRQAVEFTGVSRNTISKYIKDGKSFNGYFFERL